MPERSPRAVSPGFEGRYRAAFQGSQVDRGMNDYIRRARQAGGSDDAVGYHSRALQITVRISLTHASVSAYLPSGQEEELVRYVLEHILPYV